MVTQGDKLSVYNYLFLALNLLLKFNKTGFV